jgi:hypothetical protein
MASFYFRFYKKNYKNRINSFVFDKVHFLYIMTIIIIISLFTLSYKFIIMKYVSFEYLDYMKISLVICGIYYLYENRLINKKRKFKNILLEVSK